MAINYGAPNYKIISTYINDNVKNNVDPVDIPFNNAIAQSHKFDGDNLRGNMNQLHQELHSIINQAAYNGMNTVVNHEKPIILDDIPERNPYYPTTANSPYYSSVNPVNRNQVLRNTEPKILSDNYMPSDGYYNNQVREKFDGELAENEVNTIIKNYSTAIKSISELKNKIRDIEYISKPRQSFTKKQVEQLNKYKSRINEIKRDLSSSTISDLEILSLDEEIENEIYPDEENNSQINKSDTIKTVLVVLVLIGLFVLIYILIKNYGKKITQEKEENYSPLNPTPE